MRKIKEFYSKKNKVSLVEINFQKYIYKVHLNESSFYLEKEFYLKLKQNHDYIINTPNLVSYRENQKTLLLQYIEGSTLLEKLEELEEINDWDAELASANLILCLYNWVESFYNIDFIKKDGLVLNDINFRNFIVKDNKIYGIDFEDISKGECKDSTGRILAFYLTYNPCFTLFKNRVSKRVVDYLIGQKGFNEKKLTKNIEEELIIIKKRREKSYGQFPFTMAIKS